MLRSSLPILQFIVVMNERDDLGPSAPKAFNQSEEMLEPGRSKRCRAQNVFKTFAHRIFANLARFVIFQS